MHVGLITYQTGHLKTWQILCRLLAKSYQVTLYAFPFTPRAPSSVSFADRPHQLIDLDMPDYCSRNGIGYVAVGGWTDRDSSMLDASPFYGTPTVFLTCITKIIPQSFIGNRTILNCHPGLLPQNRGVDAFKWSVVNKWPFGITLHIIDKAIDRGTILHRIRVPVFLTDTLSDVAKRSYDLEFDLQANFDSHLDKVRYAWTVSNEYPLSHDRIPADLDEKIEQIFLERRAICVRLSTDMDAQPHPADKFDCPHVGLDARES